MFLYTLLTKVSVTAFLSNTLKRNEMKLLNRRSWSEVQRFVAINKQLYSTENENETSSYLNEEKLNGFSLAMLKEIALLYGLSGKQKRTIVRQILEIQKEGIVVSTSNKDEIFFSETSVVEKEILGGNENSRWEYFKLDDLDDEDEDANTLKNIFNAKKELRKSMKRNEATQIRHLHSNSNMDKTMEERIKAAKSNKILRNTNEPIDASAYGFESDDQLNLSKYKIDYQINSCPGCGVRFQAKDPQQPGYIPVEKLESLLAYEAAEKIKRQAESGYLSLEEMKKEVEGFPEDFDLDAEEEKLEHEEKVKEVICQRCHRLRYYQDMDQSLRPGVSAHDLLTPKRFQELLSSIRTIPCVIVYILDLFDFHGSFLNDLRRIVGGNSVVIAANKVDLLPKDMSQDRVRLWIKKEVINGGLDGIQLQDIHLLSCKTGFGVSSIMKKVREKAMELGVDIYVIGAANVGKSSFINHLLQDRTVAKGKAKYWNKILGQGLTVSIIPGTTLNFLRINLGDKIYLYDTPGLILPHQLTVKLNQEELKAVIPQKPVEHVTFRLNNGKTVLVGGLVRVELQSDQAFLFTFFISNMVKLHVTDTQKVDQFIENHVGSNLLFPPYTKERYKEFCPLKSTIFSVQCNGWRQAGTDIVLSGLGWISVTGSGKCDVKIEAPKDMLLMTRNPLMPFEAWDTTSVFTGTRAVKKGKKVQGRRV